jgi:hypothetical protein
MSSVQLSRLKPQLNALKVHFPEPKIFLDAVTSLFVMYENKNNTTYRWQARTELLFYGIPDSVMSELEVKVAALSREFPQEAITNADNLWSMPYYEHKRIAITILSKLDTSYNQALLLRLNSWISPALDEILITELFSAIDKKPEITQNDKWLSMVKSLLDSQDLKSKKLGLISLKASLSHKYHNLPGIFSLITPILLNSSNSLQKELMNVIEALIDQSETETASFILMIVEIYPSEPLLKNMRKFIPLFDKYYQNELRTALSF